MEYSIFKDGLQVGPYTLEQLRKMLSDKTISEDSFVRISGGPQDGHYPNRLLAMPSHRNRILGFLMYRYDVRGFLSGCFCPTGLFAAETSIAKRIPVSSGRGELMTMKS